MRYWTPFKVAPKDALRERVQTTSQIGIEKKKSLWFFNSKMHIQKIKILVLEVLAFCKQPNSNLMFLMNEKHSYTSQLCCYDLPVCILMN